jgi:hypothetical protein
LIDACRRGSGNDAHFQEAEEAGRGGADVGFGIVGGGVGVAEEVLVEFHELGPFWERMKDEL